MSGDPWAWTETFSRTDRLTRDAGGEVWPSDDRGLPPRTCTCEPGWLDLTGCHHEACPALDDR